MWNHTTLSVWAVEYPDGTSAEYPTLLMRSPVGRKWWSITLQDKILDTAAKVVTWLTTIYYDPYRARWVVREARSDQSAGHVNLKHPYLVPKIAIVAKPTLFYLKGDRRRWQMISCTEIAILGTI